MGGVRRHRDHRPLDAHIGAVHRPPAGDHGGRARGRPARDRAATRRSSRSASTTLPDDPGGDRAFWERIDNYDFKTFPDLSAAAAFITGQGGAAFVAHPYWSGLTPEVLLGAEGLTGLELFNASSERENGRGDSSYLWDLALEAGMSLSAIATDDSHYPLFDIGDAWTMVHAADRSREAVLDALRAGEAMPRTDPCCTTCGATATGSRSAAARAARWCSIRDTRKDGRCAPIIGDARREHGSWSGTTRAASLRAEFAARRRGPAVRPRRGDRRGRAHGLDQSRLALRRPTTRNHADVGPLPFSSTVVGSLNANRPMQQRHASSSTPGSGPARRATPDGSPRSPCRPTGRTRTSGGRSRRRPRDRTPGRHGSHRFTRRPSCRLEASPWISSAISRRRPRGRAADRARRRPPCRRRRPS